MNKKILEDIMSNSKKIMVVDDEESLRILLKGILTSEGFDVIALDSSEKCIKRLEKEKPDLLLLDVMMPGMNGIEAAKKIRATPRIRDTKIVFLTILGSNVVDCVDFDELKVSDYIAKPFDNKDLVKKIKSILSK